jgi:hypothetical protein
MKVDRYVSRAVKREISFEASQALSKVYGILTPLMVPSDF